MIVEKSLQHKLGIFQFVLYKSYVLLKQYTHRIVSTSFYKQDQVRWAGFILKDESFIIEFEENLCLTARKLHGLSKIN